MKKTFKFFKSKVFYFSGAFVLLLFALIIGYNSIDSPTIQDGYLPDEVRKVSFNAPLTVHFSQPMNKESVEANFSIKPKVQGEFNWTDDRTLEFVPDNTLEFESQYAILIQGESKSRFFKELGIDFELKFEVTGAPYVKFVSPMIEEVGEFEPVSGSGLEDVKGEPVAFVEGEAILAPSDLLIIPTDQKITVMLDRPMRALTSLDESDASQPIPEIEIDPPVKGSYRWVGTTAFQFIPDEWEMGTTYTLKIPTGIKTLDGGETDEEIVWKLATDAPRVIRTDPRMNDKLVPAHKEISLKFNQEMELDYAVPSKNVLLFPSNDMDADENLREDGYFNATATYGKDEDGRVDKTVLVFTPEFPFQYDREYQLVVNAGLAGAASTRSGGYGDRTMEEHFVLDFKTIKKPGIASFKPENGDQHYESNSIVIYFDSPMTRELVESQISIMPEFENEPSVYLNYSGLRATINYPFEPSSEYTFEFKGPFKDAVGNTAKDGFKTTFRTAPRRSNLSFLARNFGMFTEGLVPVFYAKTINIDQINIKLCEVTQSTFMGRTSNYGWSKYNCPNPLMATFDIEKNLNETQSHTFDLKAIFKRDFKQGSYFFEISSPQYFGYQKKPYRFYQAFMVSDTALTLKKSARDLLVWATDLKTGEPVARMELIVYSRTGGELARGVTDGDGIYKITKNFGDGIYVVGTKNLDGENRWSIVRHYWNDGIQSWQYGASGEWVDFGEPRIYLYTERPLYKAGDEIFFKGIFRLDEDALLQYPKTEKVKVILKGPQYDEIDSEEIYLLSDGSFDGSFTLGSEVKLGRYQLSAQVGNQRFYHQFFVEEYKKPKFKVEVLSEKADLILGESIPIDIYANYYFGGTISGEVSYTVMREPYFFNQYKGGGYYSFGTWGHFRCWWYDCGSKIEVIEQGDTTLDSKGHLRLDVSTDQEADPGQSYLYTVSVEVKNEDGEFVTKRDSFMVHQGSYYIGLNVKNYFVQPGNDLEVKMITVDPGGDIISGKKITLELHREEWSSVKKQGVDGSFYNESVRELKFIKKQTATSGNAPKSVMIEIENDMEGGRYLIQAKGEEGDRVILSESNFYVSSARYVNWGRTNNNRMELAADQPEYFVGGKAKILIKSPYGSAEKPAKALLTYERGSIHYYEVIDINSNTDTIEVSIKEWMVPNVYVTVLVIKEAGEAFDQFVALQDKSRYDAENARLDAEIETLEAEIKKITDSEENLSNRNKILVSKNERKIGEFKAEIKALGSGVIADGEAVDFALVKPDFKLGVANLLVSKREHEILINLKSKQESYLVGEPVEIEIHTYDYQNRPIKSVVSLAVVDESLLALKANRKISPLEYFYGKRTLQVTTANNLTIHVDRINVAAQKGAKGGDGADASDEYDKKRGEFKDTAYFNPVIETDDAGYAKITFDPPDNLTTWQMWAVASSSSSKFGMAKEDFVVKKPVAITSILPRFVVSGDTLTVGALVHNQSGEDVDMKIELISDGFDIKGSSVKKLSVEDGGSERVDWEIAVNPVTQDTEMTVEFKSTADTLVIKLPVNTFAYPEVVAVNGIIDDSHEEGVFIPSAVAPDMGSLYLRVGGSLITSFVKQFDALLRYPYGCAEQITSRILPFVIMFNQAAEYEDFDLVAMMGFDRGKIESIINNVLQTLPAYQRFDGGYSFWKGAYQSNRTLSSYIMFVQHLAMKAGFTVSENDFKQVVQYLWKELKKPDSTYFRIRPDTRAYMLWALSEAGELDTGMTLSLFEKREELTVYSRALMLMNLQNLLYAGQSSVKDFIKRLKSEIVSTQIMKDRLISFEEEINYYWSLNTNRRTTAMVLMALNRDNPDNPILPNIVNFLVNSRVKQGLIHTQETAWILMTMLEYAKDHNAFTADFTFDVDLNRKTVIEGTVNSDNLEEIFEEKLAISELKVGDEMNKISFEKEGDGQMHFDLELKYYLPNEMILPREKGFHITRDYYRFNDQEVNNPVKWMKSGTIYRGELNIIVPEDMYYVVVEERLPAGVEAINFNLDNTDKSMQDELEDFNRPQYEEGGYLRWVPNPLWRFNHREIRDDRVLLFADYLPKGVYTYSFLVRAGLPGKYHHLPASVHQMYFPEVFGRTGGQFMEVRE